MVKLAEDYQSKWVYFPPKWWNVKYRGGVMMYSLPFGYRDPPLPEEVQSSIKWMNDLATEGLGKWLVRVEVFEEKHYELLLFKFRHQSDSVQFKLQFL
jgi:hypothetical protein